MSTILAINHGFQEKSDVTPQYFFLLLLFLLQVGRYFCAYSNLTIFECEGGLRLPLLSMFDHWSSCIMYVDASCWERVAVAGYEIILMDQVLMVKVSLYGYTECCMSSICAEVWAVFEGLVVAVRTVVVDITIDCEVLFNMINRSIEPYLEVHTLFEDIWQLIIAHFLSIIFVLCVKNEI